MANQAARKSNVTPGKLALIGVLAVMLVAVLYIQYGDMVFKPSATSSAPAVASAKPSTKPVKSNADKKVAVAAAADDTLRKSTGSRATWQAPELAVVVGYDPFALPASFPQPATGDAESAFAQASATTAQDASVQQAALEAERTQSQSTLAALKQQGVQVIVKRGDQYVAIIGDQEVHVGDEFQGFKVVSIDANGVRLAKDLSP